MEKSGFIEKLCVELKKKNDLKAVSDTFVKGIIAERIQADFLEKIKGKDLGFDEIKRKKEFKAFFKEIRSCLRNCYGLFVVGNYAKRQKVFHSLLKDPGLENHIEMLGLHKSTKERIDYYPFLYEQIFEITGKPTKILDLGCGLNPFSYPFLDCKPEYDCCDISPDDCSMIQDFFDYFNIEGSCFCFDLTKFRETKFKGFISPDICMMLKIVDTIEKQKKGITQDILKGIQCRAFVVSFSSVSLGGKKEIKNRDWFEKRLLKNLGWKYEVIKVPNETFFIIFPGSENKKN